MIDNRTTKILKFLKEIEKLKLVLRINYLSDQKRREDDADHSWHLAMMIMSFENDLSVKFDTLKAIKIALIHDLGEIHIGDSWLPDEKRKREKAKTEETAVKKVFSTLPDDLANEFYSFWREYEDSSSIEGKVAKAFDKIIYSLQYSVAQKIDWNKRTSIHESRMYAMPAVEFDPKLVEILDSLLQEVPEYYNPA